MLLRYIKVMISISLFYSSMVQAQTISLSGRSYDYSCGYYSRRAADLRILIKDINVEQVAELNLIYGFVGQNNSGELYHWRDRTVVTMKRDGTSSWQTQLSDITLHQRSEPNLRQKVVFVFEVLNTDGSRKYINGGSTWGYYQTADLGLNSSCVEAGALPEFNSINFKVITKN